MRKEYEDWFRGFYKQEPMPELGAPAHDFCWAGYIAGAASRDAEVAELRDLLRPFAALLQDHNSKGSDEQPIFGINNATITLGDLRRALAATEHKP